MLKTSNIYSPKIKVNMEKYILKMRKYFNFFQMNIVFMMTYIILFTSFGQYFFVAVMQCGSIDYHISLCPLIWREILSQYIPRDVLGQYFPTGVNVMGARLIGKSTLPHKHHTTFKKRFEMTH